MRSAILAIVLLVLTTAASAETFDVAVTFDDLPVVTAPKEPLSRQRAITKSLTSTLRSRRVPAVGFVNGEKLLVGGRIDRKRVALLEMWLDAGAELGNHTFAHRDLHQIGPDAFGEEIVRGEAGLRELLQRRGRRLRWFRHPFLHTGTSAEVRERSERFLAAHGYEVAPVPIDNADWIFAKAYDIAIAKHDAAMAGRLRAELLAYLVDKTRYFRAQSRQLFGREIPQVLLLHANAINADTFDDLLDLLVADGARFIPLEQAVADDAYRSPDRYFGRGGISWLHRWALTAGKTRAFFAGEPTVPGYVLQLAGVDGE